MADELMNLRLIRRHSVADHTCCQVADGLFRIRRRGVDNSQGMAKRAPRLEKLTRLFRVVDRCGGPSRCNFPSRLTDCTAGTFLLLLSCTSVASGLLQLRRNRRQVGRDLPLLLLSDRR